MYCQLSRKSGPNIKEFCCSKRGILLPCTCAKREAVICLLMSENESDQHLTLGSGQARRLPDGRDQVELHQVRGEQGGAARGQIRPHRRSRAQGRGGVQETFLTIAIQIQKLVQIYKPIL